MPRFFFDSRDNNDFVRDEDGLEISDLASGRMEAARALVDLAEEGIPRAERLTLAIEVRDDGWLLFATQWVFETIRMTGEPDQFGREQSQARN